VFSDARSPRLRLVANGAVVPGVVQAEVVSNGYYSADRFRAAIAVGERGAAPWAAAEQIDVTLAVSLDGRTFVPLVAGIVDTVAIDPVANTVSLSGRDRTALLIEARTEETFLNQTASEIATRLAERHGLRADVVATTTLVGRTAAGQHDRLSLGRHGYARTEWDLLVGLAGQEGFDVWVAGDTLHFRPQATRPAAAAVLRPVAVGGQRANVTSLRLQRALTLAADIAVTVKSWDSAGKTAISQTARAQRQHGDKRGQAQKYVYIVPNLAPADALRLAQRKLAELSRHERVITAEMPGELDLAPRMMLRLEGTFTDFDQDYWIDEVERHIDIRQGFTQRLRAKSASGG
jgi:phage protein D